MNHQQQKTILSPVHGVVSRVTPYSIRIYISPTDNHRVYAPCEGPVVAVQSVNGQWKRKVFQAWHNKLARVTVVLPCVSFWLEVGEPKYITDRIRLEVSQGDEVHVGQEVGEIVLGSLAQVNFPTSGTGITFLVREGDRVVGGQTVVAQLEDVLSTPRPTLTSTLSLPAKKHLVITAPHSHCKTTDLGPKVHTCDAVAGALAQALDQKLSRVLVTHLHLADISRQTCDLNRRQCWDTPFRRRIRHDLQTLTKQDECILIDIHSFPAHHNSFGTPDTDLVLLENHTSLHPSTVALQQYVQARGLTCRILRGARNDINLEAITHFGMDQVYLVEVNESSNLDQVVAALASFLAPMSNVEEKQPTGTSTFIKEPNIRSWLFKVQTHVDCTKTRVSFTIQNGVEILYGPLPRHWQVTGLVGKATPTELETIRRRLILLFHLLADPSHNKGVSVDFV